MFVFRDALLAEPPPPFAQLVQRLSAVPIGAPFYIIAGGPAGQGVVITRNRTAAEGVAHLDPSRTEALVQTNYDLWLPDPKADPRRTRAEDMLAQIARGAKQLSTLDLFAVASAYPVHNPHTAYTAVMDPASGALTAYVRDALCPLDASIGGGETRYCRAK